MYTFVTGFLKTFLYHTGFVYIRYISLDVFFSMYLHCLRSFFFRARDLLIFLNTVLSTSVPMCLHCIYSLHILKDVSDFFIHLSCMHLSRSVQHTWVVSIYIFIAHVCHFERHICFFFL